MSEEEQKQPENEEKTEEKPKDEKKFSQSDLEYELGKRLERERSKATREREEAERKAKEKALQDQEDWKKLAEERTNTISEKDKRIEELESDQSDAQAKDERIKALENRLKAVVKPRLEAVPELYRPFVENMGVEEQAEWLEKNSDKLSVERGPNGSRPSPRPVQDTRDDKRDEDARGVAERQKVASF